MTETLAARTASLIERTREAERARRIAAGNELRELVVRNNKPRKGDEERLIAAMNVLGISAEELPETVQLLEEMASCESLIAQEADARQANAKALKGLDEVQAWREAELQRIEREAEERSTPLSAQLGQASQTLSQISEARRQLSLHLPKWKSLVEQCTFEQAQAELYPRQGVPFGAPRGASM